uniref:Nitrogen regulatory protein P-II homolog n=1 Tax=Ananas comosus var. bracteatus TaxID=296719 RepID=A0A6V7PCN0_ANACO|nr:unnamed protein product [Ananas comosus var. bracteatus]
MESKRARASDAESSVGGARCDVVHSVHRTILTVFSLKTLLGVSVQITREAFGELAIASNGGGSFHGEAESSRRHRLLLPHQSTSPLSNPKKPLSFSSRAPQLFGGLRRAPRPQLVPIIRSQSSPIPVDYVPDSKFYKIEAVLRPWRVPHVSSGLLQMGIRGVTVSDVRGFGLKAARLRGTGVYFRSEFSEDKFISKVKMEIVICKEQVEAVINKIIEEARTGEIGDGKIFLIPVSDVIRVRTGERGEMAERMNGGHADMTASVASK